MSKIENEKDIVEHVEPVADPDHDHDEKIEKGDLDHDGLLASGHIQLTAEELTHLESKLPECTAEQAKTILEEVYTVHQHDPRYDPETLERIKMFISDPNVIANPDTYHTLIYEMRIFALLTSTSSAYPEVRAVAADTDDPSIPSLTIRVWLIGTILSAIGCVINAVFVMRYPAISISSNVVQLVAYPLGVGMAKLPNWKLFGLELNPGPFNKKEHLLIVIMSGLGMAFPPTQHLILAQAMPQWFGMEYARAAGYQFLGALGTNMIGFGFAGITRRFLVYPSYCVWPASLSTIALNNALHDHAGSTTPVRGPWKTVWRASMYKCFWVVFGIYFVYYFFPGYIFPNLTIFDWIAWIKPTSGNLVAITSSNYGVGFGFNPLPTLDYNYLAMPGGYFPMFVHYNFLAGLTVGMLLAIVLWCRNVLNCGYLQINSPNTFDNKAKRYVVRNIVDAVGRLDEKKYQEYSEPYMSAGRIVAFTGQFGYTTATLTHTLLYNRHELKLGYKGVKADFKNWWSRIRGRKAEEDTVNAGDDIHYRLMQAYPEVPEWWFVIVLLLSMVVSFICLGVYSPVSPAVVMIAPIITIIFIIPVGIVTSVSGLEPSLNLISEMIGGGIAGGDTMTVMFFRMFGAEPVYHALIYANDLKLSHYVKINPRHMFWVQMWGGLLGTFITVAQWNWLMAIPNVCTPEAPFRLICPGGQADYSTFIFWGTLGAPRLFGKNGRFSWLMIGLPLGVLFPALMFFLKKRFPRNTILQSSHPLLLILSFSWVSGGSWGSYVPGLFINLFSWNFLKKRYLEFWSRYNYVTLAALGTAISINAFLVFFALVFPGVEFPAWWGNGGGTPGCIGNWTNADCARYKIGSKGYFGPDPGNFH
ncbi:hypothetical protein Q8F55_002734 [Vanrija albida]|uniref:OPT family small oligopeptide transporter n=1 Tax=Vanrija albida TaxID=181172 RepID=A0ABR3QB78_9TREE